MVSERTLFDITVGEVRVDEAFGEADARVTVDIELLAKIGGASDVAADLAGSERESLMKLR
jgi:hypothetical protein